MDNRNNTVAQRQFGARVHIAQDVELGAALQAVNDRVDGLQNDTQRMLDGILRALMPDTFPVVISVTHGQTTSRDVGNGGDAILQKITMVKIVPGAFPVSLRIKHDDIPGYFYLDSSETSIDLGITQHGNKSVEVVNNDPAVDGMVMLVYRRNQL